MIMFVEKLLPDTVAPGWSSRPAFSTYIKKMRGGAEFRNRQWRHPLRQFTAQYRHKSQAYLIDEVVTLSYEVGGSHLAFRAKDWSDYEARDEFVAVGDGATWWFRLSKRYGEYDRRILKPVPTTVTIKVNGDVVNPNSYVVDGVNGTVIFGYPPSSGAHVEWSGEFHVPVRFEDDGVETVMSTREFGTVSQFGLMETREKESISESDYEAVRGHVQAYDGVPWSTLFDILYQHVNIEWDITQ